MNPRLLFPVSLLFLVGCPKDKPEDGTTPTESDTDADTDADSDSDTDADSDADTDSDTDADTDTDTAPQGDYFLTAVGTFDGAPIDVSCEGDAFPFLGASVAIPTGGYSINLICTDTADSPTFGVAVAMAPGEAGAHDTCSISSSVQVTNGTTGAYVACALTPPTVFSLDVTEYTEDGAGNVTWAGTFEMAADDGTHSTDVTGEFRGISHAP